MRILGALEVVYQGRPVDLGPPKPRALLARLLLSPNQIVSADRLIEALWGEEGPEDPLGALQIHVSRLRKTLSNATGGGDSLIVSERPGYAIRMDPEDLDSSRFERLVTDARRLLMEGDPRLVADNLTAALALWRGPALAEFASEAFSWAEVERLEDLRLSATEELVDARLSLGHHRELVGELDIFVKRHPLRERAWAQLILALYRCGRQADALQAYQAVRRMLAQELGLDPGPQLVRLQESILAHSPELEWRRPELPAGFDSPSRTGSRPAPATDKPPDNLPLQLTSFVGREAERAEVQRRLSAARLLTLTGPGGCGKTRLALEVAAGPDPPGDGVWLADLSSLSEPGLVARTVAVALGVREEGGVPMTQSLVAALRGQDVLVILDDCEHLLDPCAALTLVLLQSCPGVRVLVTSTEPLGVPGEAVWPVPPLSLPPAGPAPSLEEVRLSEAAQLFVDRASLVRADFGLTADNAAAVALICHRLDGLPLAIELAAARVNVLSPEEIAARLNDRFRLLTGGSPAAPPRQQTLVAAVEWSHDLLSDVERAVLRRLSVFAGSCTVASAEAVCAGGEVGRGAVFDHLARLVVKSLVVLESTGIPARYRLLETIRQYGADRLDEAGETQVVRDRHARWCVDLAERAEPELTGTDQQAWLDQLDGEQANMRTAFEWLTATGQNELALRLAAALTLFWRVRSSFGEGREWLQEALPAVPEAPAALRAKAVWGAGFLTGMLGDYGAAIPLVDEALECYSWLGDQQGRGRALLLLGNFSQFGAQPGNALGLLEESTELARAAGDSWCLAHALALRGSAHLRSGDAGVARPLLEECLAVAREQRDQQSLRIGLILLGSVALNQGDYAAAEALLDEGLAVTTDLRETYGTAAALMCLGELALGRGEYDRARELITRCLVLEEQISSGGGLSDPLCLLAQLAQAEGDLVGAHALFDKARSVARTAGVACSPALWGLGELAQSRGQLGEARALYGEAMALERARGDRQGMAGGLHDLGNLAAATGDHDEAANLHRQSLRLRSLSGHLPGVVRSLEALGHLAAGDGRCGEAARLLGAAQSIREARGYARPPAALAWYKADVARAMEGISEEEFEAAWAEGALLSPDEAVFVALGPWD